MILFFPIFFIGVNIPNKKVLRSMHFLPVYVTKVILFLWRVKVDVVNPQLIDPTKQYIFIGNHTSYLDALVSALANDNLKKYIGKAEILDYPILGYLLKKIYVPVKRDDKGSRKWSMDKMETYLDSGASMVIFPEGTCNTTGLPLKEFKMGAFRLSHSLKIPLAISVYKNVKELMPRKLLSIRPGTVTIVWTKVLDPNAFESPEDMEQESRRIMLEELN